MRWLLLVSLAAALAAPASAVVGPASPADGGPLPDWDVRGLEAMGTPSAPTQAQREALARLERELEAIPGGALQVVWGPQPGTLHHLFRRRGFLTGAVQGRDAEEIARDFLFRHAGVLGLGGDAVKALVVGRRFADPGTSAVHLHFEQRVDGVEIFHGEVRAHVAADGRLLSVGGDTAPDTVLAAAVRVSAAEALALAARSVRVELDAAPTSVRVDERGWEWFTGEGFASQPIVDPTWFPVDGGLVRAWRVLVDPLGDPGWYQVVVDAGNGKVLHRHDLVENVATEGLAFREDPGQGPQVLLPFVDDSVRTDAASPFGWSEAGESRGNNCDVKDDLAADNEATEGMRALASGPDPLSFAFPFNDDPAMDLEASITNLFYLNNWLHDRLVRLGFDEASGNFQQVNVSGLGRGGDPVRVDAQDGAGRNNANFGTPPDGLPPRMQMFIWTRTNPNRDSGFDASVITHELFHGVSNRLVGGAENAGCLGGAQGGAMGEAWSDWFPCSFWDQPTVGGYLINNYVRGIRRAAYDAYPFDYGQLCNQGGFEVHRDGEIWAAVLWDLRQAFIDRYGFHVGTCKVERLVMDGMKLSPCRPTYVDMRDAILLAATLHGAAGDTCLTWEAFAGRGLGIDAVRTTGCTDGMDVTSYDVPAECAACSVDAPVLEAVDADDANGVIVRFQPGSGAAEHVLLRAQEACPGDCVEAEFVEVARGPAGATELEDRDADGNRLSAGESYSYRVLAVDGACTAPSACSRATVRGRCTQRPRSPAAEPLGVAALLRPPEATCTVELRWVEAAAACGAPGDVVYNVYRSADPAFRPGVEHLVASVPAPAVGWLDASVPGGPATYVVRAEDLTAGGDGPHGGNEEDNDARLTAAPQGLPTGTTDFFDDLEAGELPGYRRTGSFQPNDWSVVSDANTRGGSAWHVTDVEGGNADKNLHLPPLTLGTASPRLRFVHTFEFENDFDGGVIEISLDGGLTWRDLLEDFVTGAYDTSAGTGRTRTVAALINDPNTNELWTGENASGFGTHDVVEVDLAPYAGTLDAVLRFRCLVDPLAAAPGGWYVDDLEVTDVVTFDDCLAACVDPPAPSLVGATACTSATEAALIPVDASASAPGGAGWADDLPLVLTHDGPGTFGGRRWAEGPAAELTFPPGTPAGSYPVTVTARGADGCVASQTVQVVLAEPDPAPPTVGPTLRVRRDGGRLTLSWVDVGASAYEVRSMGLGADLAGLETAGEVAAVVSASPAEVAGAPGTVFFRVVSSACVR